MSIKIPKLYLDAFESIKATDSDKLVIGNLFPANKETQVSTSLTLTFDVFNFTGNANSGLVTTIEINTTDYTGSLTNVDLNSYWRRYSLILTLATDTNYDVEINTDLGAESAVSIYDFTTMDTVAPTVTGVLIDDLKDMWIGFSEEMKEATVLSSNISLLKQVGSLKSVFPASVESIERSTDDQIKAILSATDIYKIKLNDNLTIDGEYYVKCENVYDKNLNLISASGDTFDFTVPKPYYWNQNREYNRFELMYPAKWREKDETYNTLLKLDSILEADDKETFAFIDKLAWENDLNFTTIEDKLSTMLLRQKFPENWLSWFSLEQKRKIALNFPYYRQRRFTDYFIQFIELLFDRDIEVLRFPDVGWLIGASLIGAETIIDSDPDSVERFSWGVGIVDSLEIDDDIINKITVVANWWKPINEYFKGVVVDGEWVLGTSELGSTTIL